MVSNIFYFHPYLGKWSNLTKWLQIFLHTVLLQCCGTVFFFYSCLGFTDSRPHLAPWKNALQSRTNEQTIDTSRCNIMECTFQYISKESPRKWNDKTSLDSIFPCDVKISCTFFWTNPPKSMKVSFPSGVTFGVRPPTPGFSAEAHPRVGGAVWPESSHGTLAGRNGPNNGWNPGTAGQTVLRHVLRERYGPGASKYSHD